MRARHSTAQLQLRRAEVITAGCAVAALLASLVIFPVIPALSSTVGFRIAAYLGCALTGAVAAVVAWCLIPLASGSFRRHAVVAVAATCIAVVLSIVGAVAVQDGAKIVAGCALGTLIVRGVERAWWIVPAGLVASATDLWSVFAPQGVTRGVIEKHPDTIPMIAVAIPVVGTPYGGALLVGTADMLFLALFLAAARIYCLAPVRTAIMLTCALPATFVISIELMNGHAVPAVPVLTLMMLLSIGPALISNGRGQRKSR